VSLATAVILLLGGFTTGLLGGLIAGGVGGMSVGRSRAVAEYEPRITQLQDSNAVLEARVADLEVELEEARAAAAVTLPGGIELPSLDDLRDLNILQRPYLGIQFEAYDADRHGDLAGVSDGVYIVGIEPDSAAESADLRPGDVIVSADATAVQEPDDLTEAVAVHEVGDTMVLAYVRDGTRRTVRVTLGGRRLGVDGLLDRFRGGDESTTPSPETR
jgi:membrane-associated protease RseP (regulator of RpoE activity)